MDFQVWAEKYRPAKLADVINQSHALERIKAFVKDKNIPHMLFAGHAGTGKTTTALAISKELYGNNWRQSVLELNASVTPDTPILIRRNGKVRRTNFAELDKIYFSKNEEKAPIDDLEVLSIDGEYKIRFLPVSYVFRHRKEKIANIKYEGGLIKTSLDHSLIVIDKNGLLVPKRVEELKIGDHLITFKTTMNSSQDVVEVGFQPKLFSRLKSGVQRNPKIKISLDKLDLNEELLWTMGLYLAEGCTSLRNNTSGQTIFTVGYPEEERLANKVTNVFTNLGMPITTFKGKSGFDRKRESSLQVRILNTQITKFFREKFYDSRIHTAGHKRIPSFVFDIAEHNRQAFLKGYFEGEGSGDWNSVARFSSVSNECLIDVAWLGRLSDLETSCFDKEVRIIKENPKFSYIKSELLPSHLAHSILHDFKLKETRLLRHSLYSKKSNRVSKKIISELISNLEHQDSVLLSNVRKLLNSDLSVVEVKSIEIGDYDDYVYDVSVPGSQMFWGGTIPILLHNSDERGIDVIRGKVKDFARMKSIGNMPWKIVILDEADALTQEAQHALRRTMENYTSATRFILLCNYSSKIIEPIQSRCAVFRFKVLEDTDIRQYVERIVEGEKLKIEPDAIGAVVYLSEGDLRKVANLLQASAVTKENITEDIVYDIASKAKPTDVKDMLDLALKGKFIDARKKLQEMLLRQGLSGSDIISEIHRQIYSLDGISEDKKVQLIEKCGEFEFRLSEGGNEVIQIEAFLASFLIHSKSK